LGTPFFMSAMAPGRFLRQFLWNLKEKHGREPRQGIGNPGIFLMPTVYSSRAARSFTKYAPRKLRRICGCGFSGRLPVNPLISTLQLTSQLLYAGSDAPGFSLHFCSQSRGFFV